MALGVREKKTAFLELKTVMATALVLQSPNCLRFVLTTNASNATVGAILEQDLGHSLHPVAYASQKLNNAKSRYCTHGHKLLGRVWVIA